MLYGPDREREPRTHYPLSGSGRARDHERAGVLMTTTLFDDRGSLAFLDFASPDLVQPVFHLRSAHDGVGELDDFEHLEGDRYSVTSTSTAARGVRRHLRRAGALVHVDRVRGRGRARGRRAPRLHYDKGSGRFRPRRTRRARHSFSATADGSEPERLTRERVLGLAPDSSRPARMPHTSRTTAAGLGSPLPAFARARFDGSRPRSTTSTAALRARSARIRVVSMPPSRPHARGFAVFVPNARGSTGTDSTTRRGRSRLGRADRLDQCTR